MTMVTDRYLRDDIDELESTVIRRFALISRVDPDPAPVADYLTDPSAQFVATAAVAGTTIPTNLSSKTALMCAVRDLDSFYEAELVGLAPRR